MNDDKMEGILDALRGVKLILEGYGNPYQATINDFISRLENATAGNGQKVMYDKILREMKDVIFRGMGSLTDIVITKDGYSVGPAERAATDQLLKLGDQLYSRILSYLRTAESQ